jgi:hypothetical protein
VSSRIAVIIPCYNSGRFIAEALTSVQRQTRRADEIIIIDDGSTDFFTRQEIARLQGPGITVIRTANRGLSAARNRGIAETSAAYVVTLDADDRLEPRYLEATADALDNDPGLGFSTTAIQAFGEASYRWSPPPCSLPIALTRGGPHPATMFRRRVWESVGGFDETLRGCEDLQFWISAMEAGFRGLVLSEALLSYRVRRRSMHHNQVATGEYLTIMRTVLGKHRQCIEAIGPELLLEKAVLLQQQRDHFLGLNQRAVALHEQRVTLESQIGEKRLALTQSPTPAIEWGDLGKASLADAPEQSAGADHVVEYYVRAFLDEHAADLRGRTIWIADPSSTAGAAELAQMADAVADCLVLRQAIRSPHETVGVLGHARRVLRPGGVLLAVFPVGTWLGMGSPSPTSQRWGFTEASARHMCAEVFPPEYLNVRTYGNVAACVASLHGLRGDDVTERRLAESDAWHPLIVGVRATVPCRENP